MKKIHYHSAFPRDTRNQHTGEVNGQEPGMTLRDYFAAKAMQAMISTYEKNVPCESIGSSSETISVNAFKIADEMLKQREL